MHQTSNDTEVLYKYIRILILLHVSYKTKIHKLRIKYMDLHFQPVRQGNGNKNRRRMILI